MSNLFKKYETDKGLENDGIAIKFDDCTFYCRRAGGGNRRYKFAVAQAAFELKDQLNSTDEKTKADAEDEVTLRAFADAVVTDWENVEDRHGNAWPFTKENFLELMHACPDVWSYVRMEARDVDNYLLAQQQEVVENVGKSSSGSDAGLQKASIDLEPSPKPVTPLP